MDQSFKLYYEWSLVYSNFSSRRWLNIFLLIEFDLFTLFEFLRYLLIAYCFMFSISCTFLSIIKFCSKSFSSLPFCYLTTFWFDEGWGAGNRVFLPLFLAILSFIACFAYSSSYSFSALILS